MFKLEFGTDNAAFDDDKKGETGRILQEIAERIAGGDQATGSIIGRIRDVNGNEIGKYELKEE